MVQWTEVVVVARPVAKRSAALAAAATVARAVAKRSAALAAVATVACTVAKRTAVLAAAAAPVPHVVVHSVAEARRIAVALQIVVVLRVIVRRDARRALRSGIRTRDVEGRVRARGLAGHDPRVSSVAMRTVLGAPHRPLSDQASPVVEAKTPETDVGPLDLRVESPGTDAGLRGAANEGPGTEGGPPSTDRLHPEVGVGICRLNRAMIPNAQSLMSRLKITLNPYRVIPVDVVSAAREGSGFKRLFRERALRLVARLRNGFAPAVSLSTVNQRCSAYASGRLIMCGLTVA